MTRRKIVVDNEHYTWQVSQNHIYIRNDLGKRLLEADINKAGNMVLSAFSAEWEVTPFHVANLIRVEIQGKQPIERAMPLQDQEEQNEQGKTVYPGENRDAYAVIQRTYHWNDDLGAETWNEDILEITLDAALAKQRAQQLCKFYNGAARTIGAELKSGLEAVYGEEAVQDFGRYPWKWSREQNAPTGVKIELSMSLFFEEHGINNQVIKEIIRDWALGTAQRRKDETSRVEDDCQWIAREIPMIHHLVPLPEESRLVSEQSVAVSK